MVLEIKESGFAAPIGFNVFWVTQAVAEKTEICLPNPHLSP